jgi:lipoate-protein ligase B
MRSLAVTWLGRVPLERAWRTQETLRRAVVAGDASAETLLLCEHDPVVSLGRSTRAGDLPFGEAGLRARGVDVVAVTRGGGATYHGPGQLVGYPIVRLGGGVARFVEALCVAVGGVAASLGVQAEYRRARPGLWVGDAKLCAVGLSVHRRVTAHGFALNVETALEPFGWIVPCGLVGGQATSLRALGCRPPPLPELADRVGAAVAAALDRAPCPGPTLTDRDDGARAELA